jgi:hypothetical protein
MARWGALTGCVLGVVGAAWAGQVWLNDDLYYALDRTDLVVAGRVQQIELNKPRRMNDYGLIKCSTPTKSSPKLARIEGGPKRPVKQR